MSAQENDGWGEDDVATHAETLAVMKPFNVGASTIDPFEIVCAEFVEDGNGRTVYDEWGHRAILRRTTDEWTDECPTHITIALCAVQLERLPGAVAYVLVPIFMSSFNIYAVGPNGVCIAVASPGHPTWRTASPNMPWAILDT